MANNSTTPGYLAPTDLTPQGQELNRLLQQWVVGITGLDGKMVRPRWQPEPPDIPDAFVAWAAIGIENTISDAAPFVSHDPLGDGSSRLQQNETFVLMSSFYDTGANGLADALCSRLRDGCAIQNNRDMLLPIKLVSVPTDTQTVPVLLKERWLYRVDMPITMRRQIDRSYAIFNIRSVGGNLRTDDGLSRTITVEPPQ